MKTINEKQDTLISEFIKINNWEDKYKKIIEIGKACPPIKSIFKTDEYLIKGCQSKVWMNAIRRENGTMEFQVDSDALIVRGLAGLLASIFSDSTPEEILKSDIYFLEKMGLKEHLTPSRSNGLMAMLKQIKIYAYAFSLMPK